MSGDEYMPLHWRPDLGGAQAEENLARLDYFQRTREERLGEAGKMPAQDPDGEEDTDVEDSEEPDPPGESIRGHGCAR